MESVRDLDWDPARAAAFLERAAGLWRTFLEQLPTLPVARSWRPGEVRDAVAINVPEEPLAEVELFEHVRSVMFDHSVYPGHPRFMGYVTGAGTIPGAVADLLASALNQNLGGWRHSPAATEIELHLTKWFAARFGLPKTAGGMITSGGSMATFTSLKVARDRRAGWDVRQRGLREGARMVLYASTESHAVVRRAADMLGLGMDAVRPVAVDAAFRMRAGGLRDTIVADRLAGLQPFAVVATAGTTATGAIDPLPEIAGICREEGLWLHVDAAYGGAAVLADDLRPRLRGIEHADSIAFDPHKWMSTPHPGGCVLLRDLADAFDSFHLAASYTVEDRERTGGTFDFGSHGPQWSRAFTAFKIWLSLLAHGAGPYGRRISHEAALARRMGELVVQHEELELATPVSLSVCCFRYVPAGLAPDAAGREAYLDHLNERIMTEVQVDGRAYCSNALLRRRFFLRACIVNFRTEEPDVRALVDVVIEIGRRLDDEMRPAARGPAVAP
ncbi:MAG: aspartate aminotransferase family protein [Actinobacteria bacterium]|nr:MAG: aspartate aminotransferase family protein [Actinomycetota bacterium]